MSWRRLRHEMLCKHPMCQMCESEGRERFATEVHHIRPIESIEDKELQQSLAFDRDNLMCVCHEAMCLHIVVCLVMLIRDVGVRSERAGKR